VGHRDKKASKAQLVHQETLVQMVSLELMAKLEPQEEMVLLDNLV